jgi:hypothetical protein
MSGLDKEGMREKIIKERVENSRKCLEYCAYSIVYSNGYQFKCRVACYSRIVYHPLGDIWDLQRGKNNIRAIYLYLDEKYYKYRDYYEWLINSPQFGDVFVTKDFDEGYKLGFEINIEADAALFVAGIIAFRFFGEWRLFNSKIYKTNMSPEDVFMWGVKFRSVSYTGSTHGQPLVKNFSLEKFYSNKPDLCGCSWNSVGFKSGLRVFGEKEEKAPTKVDKFKEWLDEQKSEIGIC